MPKPSRIQQLHDLGFDESEFRPFGSDGHHTWKVRCSQCQALVINGLPCHETGCPNQRREEHAYD